jgi:hypothetical protein
MECVGCEVRNASRAIDGDGASFATLFMPAAASGTVALRALAQPGIVFPAGSRAGMLHSISYGDSTVVLITLATSLGGEPQEEETFNFGSGASEQDPSRPATASFPTSAPYDAVELRFSRVGGPGEVNARVHAFCSN